MDYNKLTKSIDINKPRKIKSMFPKELAKRMIRVYPIDRPIDWNELKKMNEEDMKWLHDYWND